MAVSEIFKTEFKGYSKKEVTEYIASLNEQLESLKSELSTVESKLAKCQSELEENAANAIPCEPTQEQTDELREQIKQELYGEIYEAVKAEFEQNSTAQNDELEQMRQKAEAYDDQREILAELMIKAKSDATLIYTDAQNSANALLTDAFDKFLKLRADFDEMKSNILASKAELDTRVSNINHYLNDFAQYLDFIGRDIENTGDNFKQNM